MIKTALIAGGPLWSRVRRGEGIVDRDLVLACARTKLAVVARDERDAGRRQVLNLGHTVGHAIETATGYARYRHGEAVGLGLLAALTLSGQPDLRVGGLRPAGGARAADEGSTRRSTPRPCSPPSSATRRSAAGGSGSCSSRRRATCARARRCPSATCGRRWEACCEEPRGRPARHQPRRARPPAGAALRRADVHAARAADRRVRARARARGRVLSIQLRGRVRRGAAPRAGLRGRAGAEPGRVDALRVGAARRGRDRRAAGDRGAPVRRRHARGLAARLRARGGARRQGVGQGRRGLPGGVGDHEGHRSGEPGGSRRGAAGGGRRAARHRAGEPALRHAASPAPTASPSSGRRSGASSPTSATSSRPRSRSRTSTASSARRSCWPRSRTGWTA